MKSHLKPRTCLVRWHAQSPYASLLLDRNPTRCSSLCDGHGHHASTYERPSVSQRIGRRGALTTNQNQLWRIQIP
jgi:hypothetical protein